MKTFKGKELWHNRDKTWWQEVSVNETTVDNKSLLIKPLYSLISTGTEKLVISSQIDEVTESHMKVPFMKGSFQSDFTYGYSLVGEVIKGSNSWLGKKVHLLHPHQSYAIVDQSVVTEIPKQLSLKEATLISNLETVVNAIWDGKISLGDRILIIGYGIIGSLLFKVLKSFPGVEVFVFEKSEDRRKGIAPEYLASENKEPYDAAFNVSTSAEGLQFALESVKNEGRVVELSWYGNKSITLNLGKDFHYGRKQIISSQVSQIPADKSSSWTYKRRKELVMNLLHELDFSDIISEEIDFSDAHSFFDRLRKNEIKTIGNLIKY